MYPSMLNIIAIIEKINSILYILPLQEKEILQSCLTALLDQYNVFLFVFFVVVVGQLMARSRVMLAS